LNKKYKNMTVQELIDALNAVKDKSLDVVFPYDYGVDEMHNPLPVEKIHTWHDCVSVEC
jgi:hypothetical protein